MIAAENVIGGTPIVPMPSSSSTSSSLHHPLHHLHHTQPIPGFQQQQHPQAEEAAKPPPGLARVPGVDPASQRIEVRLAEEELWLSFHKHTTEMIVTKPGRKLFPKIALIFTGMQPTVQYGVQLFFERADEFKYRYASGSWTALLDEDEKLANPFTTCNDGIVQTGAEWMSKKAEFSNFKLTNNLEDRQRSMLKVQSLHKYVPNVHIFQAIPGHPPGPSPPMMHIKSVKLTLAEFVVVTAYQNEAIRKLKTQHNPFAKGIRSGTSPSSSSSNGSRKRHSLSMSPSSEQDEEPEMKRSPPGFDAFVPSPLALPPPPGHLIPQQQPMAAFPSSPFFPPQMQAAARGYFPFPYSYPFFNYNLPQHHEAQGQSNQNFCYP